MPEVLKSITANSKTGEVALQNREIADIILSDVSSLTCDRIDALKGGHGGLVFAVTSAADRITEALLEGRDARLQNANAPHLPLDELVRYGVDQAKALGATPSNAALITALLLYFTGTAARAGVPAANRKLGALARMHAGAERCGVSNIPTQKMGNKVSGFPAVQALYDAIRRKKLTKVDGGILPLGAACGTAWGHSLLGEDIIIPEIALKGSRVATRAMWKAHEGVGVPASPIFCAIFGAAAVAEVIHADAAVAERYGPYGETDSIYLTGLGAVWEAGLAPTLHLKGSRRAFDTARVVGDLGLILKDVGSPTVVGMIAFNGFLQSFEEAGIIMPNEIGPLNSPMAHIPGAFVLPVMDLLLGNGGDVEATAERIREVRQESFDPESSFACMYVMSRKATEARLGPVTKALLAASEEPTREAVNRRIQRTQDALAADKPLAEVVREFDEERKAGVEDRAGKFFSEMFGKTIQMRFTQVRPGARRTDSFTNRYLGFDPYFDVDVTIEGQTQHLQDLWCKVLPRAVTGRINRVKLRMMGWMGKAMAKRGLVPKVQQGQEWLIPHMMNIPLSVATIAAQELTYASNCLLNIVVPAAVAVATGKHSPEEAAEIAEKASHITATIPGARSRARKVGERIEAAKQ